MTVNPRRVVGVNKHKPHMTFSVRNLNERIGPGSTEPQAAAREVSILYAEESPAVADAVKETLEAEGWRVEVCARGDEALRRLQGGARFDVLVFDFRLPGLDGVELARRARRLPRTGQTPIVMFTACEVERDARRAGVDAFLRKPRGVFRLAETIARLLARETVQV
ncbi:MAG: two-component system, sensor histidine kinase and response regulator [Acidobacteriota bacterium]|nr:two-component system, sensor histidine kinase and response regulator [Acidobacteriota bacterium]